MTTGLEIFKAYDIRGIYPSQINEAVARRIGEAYAATVKPRTIAVGRDVRSSGEPLKKELVDALIDAGINVVDIGVITTDQLYFAVGNYGYDGGISVTASHNPGEYNGFKFIAKGGEPFSSTKLKALQDWFSSKAKLEETSKGDLTSQVIIDDYLSKVLSFIDTGIIKPMNVVVNANYGAVGSGVDRIATKLGLKLRTLNWNQDGDFPKGPPNPLIKENREETSALIKAVGVDLGVAWDADADRCFFFDEQGNFIPSCYIIALLSIEFLKKYPGANIVHDVTLRWVIDETVIKHGGTPIINRVGHTFIKAKMREVDAPFAAESSGHYYFRDCFYADNGIVPFLMLLELLSKTNKTISELVKPFRSNSFVIDETNFTITDTKAALQKIESKFGKQGRIDRTDGVTIETDKWRFNVRTSNTEPLLRLNAEAKSQVDLDKLVSDLKLTLDVKS